MENLNAICGRDVRIYINGNQLLQAENVQIRKISDIHRIRSCFCNDDIGHVRGKSQYKITLSQIRFKKPFYNYNFHDLDNFTADIEFDGMSISVSDCMWDDFSVTADMEKFREHISFTALKAKVSDINA